MPHAPSRRNLALLLLRSREGVMAHFRAILHQHGLTEQQWRVLRALLDAGASTQLADREGRTPLQLARARRYTAMVQMLERAGAR